MHTYLLSRDILNPEVTLPHRIHSILTNCRIVPIYNRPCKAETKERDNRVFHGLTRWR